MSDDLAKTLAEFPSKGYVIAPAGYGKTHLIALAVKEAKHRQLILTHTFAGVNSIKTKMINLGVPSSKYQVDTIASWSLRLCLSYPKTSKWTEENPSSKEWNKLYESCSGLLAKGFIRHVVRCTYSGLYVDEYQDCSEVQHSLVSALAEFLPCRILGDPLQAIFDFEKLVDWDNSIYPQFECLGELETPWRWHNAGAHELGNWLKEVRDNLNVLKIHIDGEALTLLEAAQIYQREFRHSGRPIRHTKLIGTTLLVKGLEYDHAIVLDAGILELKHLYVAMTRGSKSLTIITTKDSLP